MPAAPQQTDVLQNTFVLWPVCSKRGWGGVHTVVAELAEFTRGEICIVCLPHANLGSLVRTRPSYESVSSASYIPFKTTNVRTTTSSTPAPDTGASHLGASSQMPTAVPCTPRTEVPPPHKIPSSIETPVTTKS